MRQPALPEPRRRASQALRVARRARHRGRRREARRPAVRARDRPAAQRPVPAHGRAAARAGRFPGAVGGQRDRVDRGLQAAALRRRAVRPRNPARGLGQRPAAGPPLRLDRGPAGGVGGGDRRRPGRRHGDRRGRGRLVRRPRPPGAGGRSRGGRRAARAVGGRASARGRPPDRQDLRADGHAVGAARRLRAAHRRGRRQGVGLGVGEDGLRGGGQRGGLEARESREARRRRCWTRPASRRCCSRSG